MDKLNIVVCIGTFRTDIVGPGKKLSSVATPAPAVLAIAFVGGALVLVAVLVVGLSLYTDLADRVAVLSSAGAVALAAAWATRRDGRPYLTLRDRASGTDQERREIVTGECATCLKDAQTEVQPASVARPAAQGLLSPTADASSPLGALGAGAGPKRII